MFKLIYINVNELENITFDCDETFYKLKIINLIR